MTSFRMVRMTNHFGERVPLLSHILNQIQLIMNGLPGYVSKGHCFSLGLGKKKKLDLFSDFLDGHVNYDAHVNHSFRA